MDHLEITQNKEEMILYDLVYYSSRPDDAQTILNNLIDTYAKDLEYFVELFAMLPLLFKITDHIPHVKNRDAIVRFLLIAYREFFADDTVKLVEPLAPQFPGASGP